MFIILLLNQNHSVLENTEKIYIYTHVALGYIESIFFVYFS